MNVDRQLWQLISDFNLQPIFFKKAVFNVLWFKGAIWETVELVQQLQHNVSRWRKFSLQLMLLHPFCTHTKYVYIYIHILFFLPGSFPFPRMSINTNMSLWNGGFYEIGNYEYLEDVLAFLESLSVGEKANESKEQWVLIDLVCFQSCKNCLFKFSVIARTLNKYGPQRLMSSSKNVLNWYEC